MKKAASAPLGEAGFTRTELLIVIAVVAILVAALVPLLSWAKLRSQRIRCQGGSVKVLLQAEAAYVSEHERALPRNPTNCPGGLWMGALRDYYESDAALLCPSAPVRPPTPTPEQINRQGTADRAWAHWSDDRQTLFVGSMGRNVWMCEAYAPSLKVPGLSPEQFRSLFLDKPDKMEHPDKAPVFMDANWVDARPMETDSACNNLYTGRLLATSFKDMGRLTIARHGNAKPSRAPRDFPNGRPLPGAINIGMFDGHVELAPLDKLWTYEWHRDWKTPRVRPEVER
ncbi:MAG: type II secretion system protein [Verrucomicrobia bacterium]|nr:type II secretion system protein [Verrucomicrobiota bacterium]